MHSSTLVCLNNILMSIYVHKHAYTDIQMCFIYSLVCIFFSFIRSFFFVCYFILYQFFVCECKSFESQDKGQEILH